MTESTRPDSPVCSVLLSSPCRSRFMAPCAAQLRHSYTSSAFEDSKFQSSWGHVHLCILSVHVDACLYSSPLPPPAGPSVLHVRSSEDPDSKVLSLLSNGHTARRTAACLCSRCDRWCQTTCILIGGLCHPSIPPMAEGILRRFPGDAGAVDVGYMAANW